MNLFFYISGLFALSELLNEQGILSYNVKSGKNTVYYIQSNIYENLEKTFNYNVTIKIYYVNNDGTEHHLFSDKKSKFENTFFFTFPLSGQYIIDVVVTDKKGNPPSLSKKISIETKTYNGNENSTHILSHGDVEVGRLGPFMENLYINSKNMINEYNIDLEENNEFSDIYDSIKFKVFYSVLLRIIAIIVSQYLSSKVMRRFFTSGSVAIGKDVKY